MVFPSIRSFQELSIAHSSYCSQSIKELANGSSKDSQANQKKSNITSKRLIKKSILRLKENFEYPLAS